MLVRNAVVPSSAVGTAGGCGDVLPALDTSEAPGVGVKTAGPGVGVETGACVGVEETAGAWEITGVVLPDLSVTLWLGDTILTEGFSIFRMGDTERAAAAGNGTLGAGPPLVGVVP